MARPILVPQVGQDLTEGKIVELRVGVGDAVTKGDIVAVVESEKASFDVEAFDSGTVLDIRYKEGDTATVLEPLLFLGQPGEQVGGAAPSQADGAAKASPAELVELASDPLEANPPDVPAQALQAPARGSKLRSSPLARRLAEQHGLDLRAIAGSGERGSIVKRDIDAALDAGRRGGAAARQVEAPRRDTPATRPPMPGAPTGAGQGGILLRTLRDGVGDPLLLLHGFGSELGSWRTFITHLSLANPILALDLPGHGGSPEPAEAGFDGLIRDVEDALAGAGLSRLHLVGHSLGGAVGAALAGGGGLDVRSLCLLAPAGLGPRINGEFLQGFCAAESEAELRAWLTILVHDPAALPGALVRATMRAREETDLAGAQKRLAAALFPNGTQIFSIRPALQRFAGPVRAIFGREDAIIPPHHGEALPGAAALHRLAGVGHLPQLEATALVARLSMETVRSAG